MLVVKIELWPFGDKDRAVRLHEGVIFNDGSGTLDVGNYKAVFFEKDEHGRPEHAQVWKQGVVKDFKRLEHNAWELLKLALDKAK